MALIDLGELRGEPEPVHRSGRRRSRPAGRPGPVLLVLLLVLVTVAGAVPAPRRLSVTLTVPPGATVYWAGDRLVAVGPVELGTDGDFQVVAFDVPAEGPTATTALTPRWRTTVPQVTGLRPMGDVAGVLLLVGIRAGSEEMVTLDLATGRPGWRQPGSGMPTERDGILLLTGDGDDRTLRVVEPRTGVLRWSVRGVPQQVDYRFGGHGIDRLLWSTPEGRAEIRDADTGSVLATAPLRVSAPVPGGQPQFLDDLLLVVRTDPPLVSAYELDRLTPRWTASVPSVSHLQPCGVVLCAWGETGGMWALDPDTGRTRWSDPRWTMAVPAADRVLVTDSPRHSENLIVVLDASTGRTVRELGEWRGLGTPEDGRLTVFRPVGDRAAMVAELDVEAGETRVVDVLPGSLDQCQLGTWPVLCQEEGGSYRLWWPPN
ncbi:PQQ-binding-like beta-propeller repeat protein [Micromonospora cathayae]|uniref:PQQ-binding-like beta-propeller repeat protein n=1 Tax=Micromonospora cathayae TaxID=3028804 RepID=A0ABY7ZX73_9ACTN|nr:PQQ-binding-like beta-propeller repeat protein [Micromonospora sp. HUAS 3]WDZ87632.1 PQQ-binding-like beta-propeller repeat protein [Micromonospora sp. HUAS 3]